MELWKGNNFMLKVNEIFLSIQGEGITTGFPTVFLRLTGCNLRCNYCDTTYSHQEGELMTLAKIIDKIKSFGIKRLCLTGGEPLLQPKIIKLLNILDDYEINIETNGSIDIRNFQLGVAQRFTMDVKTPSSGEEDSLCVTNFKYLRDIDELKFVIANRADYQWSKAIIDKYYSKGIITFSPVFGVINSKNIIHWILEDRLDARFQLQLHKIIWQPEERGV